MSLQQISTIHFVDDSDDEIFISKVLFERQAIDLEIQHFVDFDAYLEHLERLDDAAVEACVAVIDLNLTVSKGTDGIARVRDDERFASLLIGVCSGSEDPADIKSADEAGASFFVPKPLDESAVRQICDEVSSLEFAELNGRKQLMRVNSAGGRQ